MKNGFYLCNDEKRTWPKVKFGEDRGYNLFTKAEYESLFTTNGWGWKPKHETEIIATVVPHGVWEW